MTGSRVAYVVVSLVVSAVLIALCLLGYGLAALVDVSERWGLPRGVRIGGGVLLITGLALFVWIFRHRAIGDVLYSTYVSLRKAARGSRGERPEGRSERLVLSGPQRFVRHPLYTAVVLLTLGLWMALDYTFLVFAALLLLAWFRIVVIPFEERELRALFGPRYEDYVSRTPRLVPSVRALLSSRRAVPPAATPGDRAADPHESHREVSP